MLYNVVLSGVTAAAPSDGFIDPKTVYVYMNEDVNNKPTTYANSTAKARANRRHRNIINTVIHYSDMKIVSWTVGGNPTSNVAPTSITYQVETNGFTTPDENNQGQFLSGSLAIERVFARALIRPTETIQLEVYDPTLTTAPGNSTPWARTGPRFENIAVGPLYASIAAADAGIVVTSV